MGFVKVYKEMPDIPNYPVYDAFVEVKLVGQPWSKPVATGHTDWSGTVYLEIAHLQYQDLRVTKTGFVQYVLKNALLNNYEIYDVHLQEAPPPITPLFPLIPLAVGCFFLFLLKR